MTPVHTRFCRSQELTKRTRWILLLILLVPFTSCMFVGYYFSQKNYRSRCNLIASIRWMNLPVLERPSVNELHVSSNVHIVNSSEIVPSRFRCLQTKTLLNRTSTHICLHETKKDVYVSGAYRDTQSIWEEAKVTRILQYLLRHPRLHFIDVGANIGAYTMYVAALGRFVLAIDCFAPNMARLRRSVQLANVTDHVVLVQNAIYKHSGQHLRLSVDTRNIGGQGISIARNQSAGNASRPNPYVVQTILFDEILPILVGRGIRAAMMKIDIEGSENFVVETGSRVFDTLDIPLVQMEWTQVSRNVDRATVILRFFAHRQFDPMTESCEQLNPSNYALWPPDVYWVQRNASNFCQSF